MDMTTSQPSLAVEIYEAAKKKNVFSLDAPGWFLPPLCNSQCPEATSALAMRSSRLWWEETARSLIASCLSSRYVCSAFF